jgi:V8-like Glu-specific endopeptidase
MYKKEKKINIEFLQKRLKTDLNQNLSEDLIQNRIETSKKTLKDFVKNNLGNKKELNSLVDQIVEEGGDSMRALMNNDANYINNNRKKLENLEIVVITDGSRPSFLIKNNQIDTTSSPITDWGEMLTARKDYLDFAIGCVGRIDSFGTKIGTGFLIAKNLILTNKHVLEAISNNYQNNWAIYKGANIDFGFEFKGIKSQNKCQLKSVVFCGDKEINGKLDHKNLDIALIEIENNKNILNYLPLNLNSNWANDEQTIFTIGYPTTSEGYSYSLLDLLFKSQFGFKRISPGRIQSNIDTSLPPWTFSHDATTLGGNSGSVIILLNDEKISAGIHYGGTKAPLSNWGHIIGATLDVKFNGQTFKEILEIHHVITTNS